MNQLRQLIIECLCESDDYKEFFQNALDKFGIKSPAELSPEKKKEFFKYVEDNWTTENPETNDKDVSENKIILKRNIKADNYYFVGKVPVELAYMMENKSKLTYEYIEQIIEGTIPDGVEPRIFASPSEATNALEYVKKASPFITETLQLVSQAGGPKRVKARKRDQILMNDELEDSMEEKMEFEPQLGGTASVAARKRKRMLK